MRPLPRPSRGSSIATASPGRFGGAAAGLRGGARLGHRRPPRPAPPRSAGDPALRAATVSSCPPAASGSGGIATHSPRALARTRSSTRSPARSSTSAPGAARPATTARPSRSTRTMSKLGRTTSGMPAATSCAGAALAAASSAGSLPEPSGDRSITTAPGRVGSVGSGEPPSSAASVRRIDASTRGTAAGRSAAVAPAAGADGGAPDRWRECRASAAAGTLARSTGWRPAAPRRARPYREAWPGRRVQARPRERRRERVRTPRGERQWGRAPPRCAPHWPPRPTADQAGRAARQRAARPRPVPARAGAPSRRRAARAAAAPGRRPGHSARPARSPPRPRVRSARSPRPSAPAPAPRSPRIRRRPPGRAGQGVRLWRRPERLAGSHDRRSRRGPRPSGGRSGRALARSGPGSRYRAPGAQPPGRRRWRPARRSRAAPSAARVARSGGPRRGLLDRRLRPGGARDRLGRIRRARRPASPRRTAPGARAARPKDDEVIAVNIQLTLMPQDRPNRLRLQRISAMRRDAARSRPADRRGGAARSQRRCPSAAPRRLWP